MKFLLVLSVVAFASCNPVPQNESVMKLVLSNVLSCVNSDLGICLKEQALKATERLGSVRALKITEGITIINNGPKEAKALELSSEPEERRRQLTDKLWESATDLMKNSELELSMPASDDDDEKSRALDGNVEEGRGKKKEIKKKLKILIPLLLLAKAKAVAIAIAALVVIAASLFKIAVLAKIAFIVKAIIFLKHLLHKKHEEDHGWVPHHEAHGWVPHHEGHGWDAAPAHGWDGGWSRSRNEANNLAYSGYSS